MTNIFEIKGITQQQANLLRDRAGISTVEALWRATRTPTDRRRLASQLGISAKLIREWSNRADLMRLTGVGRQYSDLLEEADVNTVRELSHRVPANLHRKLAEINQQRHLVKRLPTRDQVTEWVSDAKVKTSSPHAGTPGWWTTATNSWLEILICIAVLAALVLVARGRLVDQSKLQPVVIAQHEVAPYAVIDWDQQLAVRSMEPVEGGFAVAQELHGRYTLQRLEAGKPVTESQISKLPAPGDLGARQIIALPGTSVSTLGNALAASDRATLLLAARPGSDPQAQAAEFTNVLILDVQPATAPGTPKGGTDCPLAVDAIIIVGILKDDMERLRPLLGISEVYFGPPE